MKPPEPKIPPFPGPELLDFVRGQFVSRGRSLTRWCRVRNIGASNARSALLGKWDGPKARELRRRLIEASLGNDEYPALRVLFAELEKPDGDPPRLFSRFVSKKGVLKYRLARRAYRALPPDARRKLREMIRLVYESLSLQSFTWSLLEALGYLALLLVELHENKD